MGVRKPINHNNNETKEIELKIISKINKNDVCKENKTSK